MRERRTAAGKGRGRRRSGPPAEPVLLAEVELPSRLHTNDSGLGPQSADPPVLRVSAIEKQERRGRYNVFVDGEFALALDAEILAGSGLRVDQPVTAERLRELSVTDLRKRALDAALRFLAPRPRSETEIRQRLLRRGLPHDIVVATLERLREHGYVDDAEFSRFWVESRSGANPRGPIAVRQELRSKGVDQETVASAIEALPEERSARKAARKKLPSLRALEYQDFRTRLSGYLLRRGFTYDTVRTVVNDSWRELHNETPEDSAWDE